MSADSPVRSAQPESPRTAKTRSPNILLIYTDDQSWRTLSCYEETPPWVSTPNIDRLACEGTRFTHAYGAPSCVVSRVSLLTGLLPHAVQGFRHVGTESTYDPRRCRFWPAALRQAGYRTAVIGKWHLGTDAGQGRDWDHSVIWRHVGTRLRDAAYHNPKLSIDGQPARTVPGYSTDLYTGFAVDVIRRERGRPWCLWLCYNAPHGPTLPHDRHRDRYRDATQGNYHRTICAIDDGIAEIRKALEETGQLGDTLLVFTSDNGFAWDDHRVSGKLAPYDANMRVPMIVRYPPSAQPGAVCRSPVSIIDLAPTLLALAGIAQPWPMHGHDLQPLFSDPQARWDHPVVLENFYLHFGPETDCGRTSGPMYPGIPWWISLTDARYHYIRTLVPDAVEEFYDRGTDPLELKNLALEPHQAGALADYRQRLIAELKQMTAALADNLPPPRIV